MKSIYVASSVYRTTEFEHTQCVLKLMARTEPQIIYHPVGGDALIERSRAIAATRFLRDSDAPVMLMIDGDIVFKPEDALAVAEAAEAQGSIVCGVYATRNANRCFPAAFFEPGHPVVFDGEHRAEPIRWGASGFMAVSRAVVEKLAKRDDMPLLHKNHPLGHCFHPFFTPFPYTLETGEHILLSEDYAFCERAREEGFTVYCDPGVTLLHLGVYAYELGDMVQPNKYRGPMRVTRTVEGTHRVERPEEKPVTELFVPKGAIDRERLHDKVPALAL